MEGFPTQDSTLTAVKESLRGFGGFLRCRDCNKHKHLGDIGMKLKNGWPRCCGHTMEWITQRQIDEGYLDDPDAWLAKERSK